jgi:superfamily II DNA or RNA helicase
LIQLRPYQTKIIEEVRQEFKRGNKAVVLCLATGAGKTALTAEMIKTCTAKDMKSWFCVHRRELVKQVVLALEKAGVEHDIVANGFIETRGAQVKVCSIGALRTRLKRMMPPNLIVIDEAHHARAKSYAALFTSFPKAYQIGLTATPERLDGQGLGQYYKVIVKGPSVRELIAQGYLSDYRIFAPPGGIDTEGLHTRAGDFAKEELNARADKPTITGNALNEYLKHAMGKRAVAFCTSVANSQKTVAMFMANGVQAVHVDGETPMAVRDEAIRLFSQGKIQVLGNVDLFGEGFDLPTLECVILLRPTQSIGLYRQQVGRALRPSDGKSHAIILDHAGNVARHGLPEDVIEWRLEGRSREAVKAEAQVKVRICPKCYAAQYPGSSACKFCGHVFEIKERKVAKKEGPLTEVDIQAMRDKSQKKHEQGSARSYEDLVAVGIKRGMVNPIGWAKHVMKGREEKEARI